MPFAPKVMTEDEKLKSRQKNGYGVSGQSGTFATGVPGQEESTTPKRQSGSGQYANIQSYLDANRDQSNQMGQQVVNTIETKANDAISRVQGLGPKVPQVGAYDPNETLKRVKTLSEDEKANYRHMKQTGGYTGPKEINEIGGYQDTQKAVTDAAGLVSNAGQELGQQDLLRSVYKRPNYTAGQNKLDQVIMQQGGSRQRLEGISNKYKGLTDLFNETSSKAGEAINKAKGQALANQQAIATAEGSVFNPYLQALESRVSERKMANKQEADTIEEMLKTGKTDFSDEQLSDLGVSRDQWNSFITGHNAYKNLLARDARIQPGAASFDDLSSYFQRGGDNTSIDTIATKDEYDTFKALRDLIGLDDGSYLSDASLAQTATDDLTNFDLDSVLGRLNEATGHKTDELNKFLSADRLSEETRNAVDSAVGEIKEIQTDPAYPVKNVMKDVYGGGIRPIQNLVDNLADGAWDAVVDTVSNPMPVLQPIYQPVMDLVGGVGRAVGSGLDRARDDFERSDANPINWFR